MGYRYLLPTTNLVGNGIGIEEDVVVVPLAWPCGVSMNFGI